MENLMALFWLIVIVISTYYLVKHGKFNTTNSGKYKQDQSFKDSFQKTLAVIRENRKRRETDEDVYLSSDPAARAYRHQLSRMFKPGFQNDPEWQKRSKAISETIKRNRALSKL